MIDISPKTCEILDNFEQSSDKLLIMSGAYRSLKTTAASFAVLHIINKHPSGKFMILGKTLDSIKRNVVSSLIECLGGDNVIYKGGNSPSVYVCGKEFECIGCSDVKSAEIVKGSTRHGILVDEAIVIPKLTWEVALSRLSPPGAVLIATTNPGNPNHWLHKDYIKNQMISTTTYQLQMSDNPFLTEEYVNFMKATHTGINYRRYILGEWVAAEGIIFPEFTDAHIYDEDPDFSQAEFGVFVDYGSTVPTCFLKMSLDNARTPRLFVHEEYYYDSVASNHTKTEIEYTRDFLEFTADFKPLRWAQCDPHEHSFIASVRQNSDINMMRASNRVDKGLRNLGTLFHMNELGIHKRCTNLIRELQCYVWDPKETEKGQDAPLKENDHAVDALRYGALAMNKQMSEKVEQTSLYIREHHDMGIRKLNTRPAHKWDEQMGTESWKLHEQMMTELGNLGNRTGITSMR